jgi:hypothetical protein
MAHESKSNGQKVFDLSNYNEKYSDEQKIYSGTWVPCRICKQIFLRVRLTLRFCRTCGRAFCEGEHGSFTGRGPGVCVRCYKTRGGELR